MLLAPVPLVIRASVFGVAALLLFTSSCSVLPNESHTWRVKRVEEVVLPMARVALEAEQTETARRLYLRLLDVDPDSVSARMGLGNVATAQRESAEAVRWYAAAVAHATGAEEHQAALLAHGRAALSGGELEAARRSFSRLTSPRESAPTLTVAWGLNGLGLVALLEGDIDGALRLMEQAVLLAPDENRLSENLARALDLFARMAPESAGVDRMRGMAAEPDSAPLRNGPKPAITGREMAADESRKAVREKTAARPGEADRAVRPAEPVPAEDETPEEPIELDRSREIHEQQTRRPESEEPSAGVGPINRSELHPHAIRVGGEYYVRIGAYALPVAARAIALEIRRITPEPVDVVEFGMGSGRNAVRLYRVLIGPIASEAGLSELTAALDELGYGAARVPASVARESTPEATEPPAVASQHSTGPELVELLLIPGGEEGTEMPVSAREPSPSRVPESTVQPHAATLEVGVEETRTVPAPAGQDEVRAAGVDQETTPGNEADPPGEDMAVSVILAQAASGETVDTTASDDVAGSDNAGRSRSVGDPAREMGVSPRPEQEQQGSVATPPQDPSSYELPSADPVPGETTEHRGWSPGDIGVSVEYPDARGRFLQVGAFTVRSTAEALAAEVGLDARVPVRVIEAELANGETMYRVQVGPVSSLEAMMELDNLLTSRGFGTVRILPGSAVPGDDESNPPVAPPPSPQPQRRVKAFIVEEEAGRFLQMGAYGVRATADTLSSQLRLVTAEPVFVTETPTGDGGFLYRVRIGPIASNASFGNLIRALRSGYGAGWVLPSVEANAGRVAFLVDDDSERFLQMGAYADRSAANALVSELHGQIDGEVRITEVPRRGGKPLYRVRIGPIVSEESLLALVEAVESLGYLVD